MSLHPGAKVLIKIMCPSCGTLTDNWQPQDSDFFLVNCHNQECDLRSASAVIEKRSGIVLSVTQWEFRDALGNWHRQVWEKVPEEPKKAV